LEVDNLVGVNENDNVFKNIFMQEEICGPEVKRTKQPCGHFGTPTVECISKLRATPCQSMLWPFGMVRATGHHLVVVIAVINHGVYEVCVANVATD